MFSRSAAVPAADHRRDRCLPRSGRPPGSDGSQPGSPRIIGAGHAADGRGLQPAAGLGAAGGQPGRLRRPRGPGPRHRGGRSPAQRDPGDQQGEDRPRCWPPCARSCASRPGPSPSVARARRRPAGSPPESRHATPLAWAARCSANSWSGCVPGSRSSRPPTGRCSGSARRSARGSGARRRAGRGARPLPGAGDHRAGGGAPPASPRPARRARTGAHRRRPQRRAALGCVEPDPDRSAELIAALRDQTDRGARRTSGGWSTTCVRRRWTASGWSARCAGVRDAAHPPGRRRPLAVTVERTGRSPSCRPRSRWPPTGSSTEALTNVTRHSSARPRRVTLASTAAPCSSRSHDDGDNRRRRVAARRGADLDARAGRRAGRQCTIRTTDRRPGRRGCRSPLGRLDELAATLDRCFGP